MLDCLACEIPYRSAKSSFSIPNLKHTRTNKNWFSSLSLSDLLVAVLLYFVDVMFFFPLQ